MDLKNLKKPELLSPAGDFEKLKAAVRYGAIKRGVPERVADKIFNEVVVFAGYAFNKSHAACYAIVGYYPHDFLDHSLFF